MSPIIELQRRIVEAGRIRLGHKDGNRPVKGDTLRFTSRDHQRIHHIARLYGGTPQPWQDQHEVITHATNVQVAILPGQTISTWYEQWTAGGCKRRCDGITDTITDQPCDCNPDQRACKPHTRLNVLLPEIPGIGCWRLESTGYYAAVELAGTADLLEQLTQKAGIIPARLRLEQRMVKRDGQTLRFAVPVLDLDVKLTEVRAIMGATPYTPPVAELGHTPLAIEQATVTVVTVQDGLDAANRQAQPKARTARSAEPIGATIDFTNHAPVPVPFEDPAGAPTSPPAGQAAAPTPHIPGAAAAEPKPATAPQKKRLDVLVGQLRDQGRITTQQLYGRVATIRNTLPENVIDQAGGLDDNGDLHWAPLRETLNRAEAMELIDRLEDYQQRTQPEPPPILDGQEELL